MSDLSHRASGQQSFSLVPGVIYEWTPAGIAPVAAAAENEEFEPPPGLAVLAAGFEPVAGYRLAERIGQGCTGQVWRATGPGGVAVALKFVELGQRGASQELRSLATMLGVRHANLVTIFGIWEQADWAVIGMDLADGSLLDRFEAAVVAGRTGLDFAALIDFLRQAARGIDFLNEPRSPLTAGNPLGLIHRDIKPRNLLLVGESIKIGDFGLVRPLDADSGSSLSVGTEAVDSLMTAYSAPEVRRGGVSASSDQYSLAATYCHLRGGAVPTILSQPLAPLDLSMLPGAERSVVARALAVVPADRWPNCSAFVEALVGAAWQPSPERVARPGPGPHRMGAPGAAGSRWSRRPLAAAALGLGGLAVLALIGVIRGPLSTGNAPDLRPEVAVQPEPVSPPYPEVATPAPLQPEPVVTTAAIIDADLLPLPRSLPSIPNQPLASSPPPSLEPVLVDTPGETTRIEVQSGPAGSELAAAFLAWGNATRTRLETSFAAVLTGIDARIKAIPRPFLLVGPPDPPLPRRPSRVAQKLTEPPVLRTATIIVRMPSMKAELVVRGEVGRGNPDEWYGPRRVIHSPPLMGPQDYLIGAFWTDPGGRPQTRSQPLKVEPGRLYEVDLRAETPTFTEVPRSPAS